MGVTKAPTNEIGWTHYGGWDDNMRGPPLTGQLTDKGVPFERIELPHLVGLQGHAALVCYTSPLSGQPVTVLCVLYRPEIDVFVEEYFYFEGVAKEEALRDERRWITAYGVARGLQRRGRQVEEDE